MKKTKHHVGGVPVNHLAPKRSQSDSSLDESSFSKTVEGAGNMEVAVSSILYTDDPITYFVLVHNYSEFVSGTKFMEILTKGISSDANHFSRILTILSLWLENRFWDEFWKEGKATPLLRYFIDVVLKQAVELNSTSYSSKFEPELNRIKLLLIQCSRKLPPSSLNPSALIGQDFDEKREARDFVLSFWILEPRLIAEQFAAIEHSLFRKVKEKELMNLNWKKKSSNYPSWNVLNMVERFNNVSSWVCTKILKQEDNDQRVGLIRKFVEIAEKCAELRNFNTLMSILAALNCHPVERLRQTWAAVPDRTLEIKAELEELMETRNNYKNYREALEKAKMTNTFALPYFGVYLRDLVFIEEGNATDKGGLVNLEKIQLISNVLQDMKWFQRKEFVNRSADSDTQSFFLVLKGLPEEELDKLSQQREALRSQQTPTNSNPEVSGVQDASGSGN